MRELWAFILREKWDCKVSVDEELILLMSCLFSLLQRSVQRKMKQLWWADHILEVPPFSEMASARSWLFLLMRTNTITGEVGVKEHHHFMSAACLACLMGSQRRQMWLIKDTAVLLLNSDLKYQFQVLRAVYSVPRHDWFLEWSALTTDFFLSWHHPYGAPGICSACN